jgi:ABC-2 type transport system ATP-binding protein
VREGEGLAILGHNGSGKSTCLKLLAGTIAPSAGQILCRGKVAPLLELGAGFHPDLTGRENVFLNGAILGVPRSYLRAHLEEIIEFSGLGDAIDLPVRFYSSGMGARLGFSIAVNVDPDVLLVDEVLAVGDQGFQEQCLERMRLLQAGGRTLVLVTHSLSLAQEFCSRIIVLDRGRLTFDGPAAAADEAVYTATHALSSGSEAVVPE